MLHVFAGIYKVASVFSPCRSLTIVTPLYWILQVSRDLKSDTRKYAWKGPVFTIDNLLWHLTARVWLEEYSRAGGDAQVSLGFPLRFTLFDNHKNAPPLKFNSIKIGPTWWWWSICDPICGNNYSNSMSLKQCNERVFIRLYFFWTYDRFRNNRLRYLMLYRLPLLDKDRISLMKDTKGYFQNDVN